MGNSTWHGTKSTWDGQTGQRQTTDRQRQRQADKVTGDQQGQTKQN